MTKKLSIVIPCFNEAKNITIVLQKFKDILQETSHRIEVIVVDGGSTDYTPQELTREFQALDPSKFILILRKERGGYGNDLMHGLAQASGDVLAWTHTDLQTDPYDVIKAYKVYLKEIQKTEKILIKGKRKNRQVLEAFFTFGMQIIVFIFLRKYLSDINAQPKLFSRVFYEKYLRTDYPADFSLDLFTLYQAKRYDYQILTIPVYFSKRQYGEAKGGSGAWLNRLKLIQRTFSYVFELKRKFAQTKRN